MWLICNELKKGKPDVGIRQYASTLVVVNENE